MTTIIWNNVSKPTKRNLSFKFFISHRRIISVFRFIVLLAYRHFHRILYNDVHEGGHRARVRRLNIYAANFINSFCNELNFWCVIYYYYYYLFHNYSLSSQLFDKHTMPRYMMSIRGRANEEEWLKLTTDTHYIALILKKITL